MSKKHELDDAVQEARAAIDAIDLQLVELFNLRASHAREIGRVKHALGEAVYQPEREKQVFARVCEANDGPLADEAIRRLFERVLDEARRLERLKAQ